MLTGRYVLIVDDSRVARAELRRALERENAEVEEAGDPFEAVEHIRNRVPDAIVLDVEMPKMSGLTFLSKLMMQHPIPVVVCSSAAMTNPKIAFDALESGALEVLGKPDFRNMDVAEWSASVLEAVSKAVDTPRSRLRALPGRSGLTRPSFPFEMPTPVRQPGRNSDFVLAVGASTGGTRALAELLKGFSAETPGTVVVQHMPKAFTAPFAQHLDRISPVSVKEAEHGDRLTQGRVLIAPGGLQLEVVRCVGGYAVELKEAPPVNRHCPSVDVLFDSVAAAAGRRSAAALLTGMGDDGARGLQRLHSAGAHTIAQDEASCVVFGMPREAIRRGGADEVLPLGKIAAALMAAAERKGRISV